MPIKITKDKYTEIYANGIDIKYSVTESILLR